MTEQQPFDSWAIVEMLGHRRVIGRVTEQVIAGAGFIRIDVPGEGGDPAVTQIVAPASIYCITPVSEQVARLTARARPVRPITTWDLPQDIRDMIRKAEFAPQLDDGADIPF